MTRDTTGVASPNVFPVSFVTRRDRDYREGSRFRSKTVREREGMGFGIVLSSCMVRSATGKACAVVLCVT